MKKIEFKRKDGTSISKQDKKYKKKRCDKKCLMI